jgi:hypothetical protein
MAISELSARVAALEAEVALIKQQLREAPPAKKKDWLDDWYGAFANDPHFDEAMRLGREYRESLRPKKTRMTRQKTVKNASSRRRKVSR